MNRGFAGLVFSRVFTVDLLFYKQFSSRATTRKQSNLELKKIPHHNVNKLGGKYKYTGVKYLYKKLFFPQACSYNLQKMSNLNNSPRLTNFLQSYNVYVLDTVIIFVSWFTIIEFYEVYITICYEIK